MQQRESARKAVAARARGASFDASQGSKLVAQTAAWIVRAKSVLKDPSSENPPLQQGPGDLQTQMQQVQQLIHEGPIIQQMQSTPGLSDTLDQPEEQVSSPGSPAEPADKRLRTAEDAEALVGFLRSVRASAASGQDL